MSEFGDQIALLALIVSITSGVFTLIQFKSNTKAQRRAATVSAFTEIVNQIGNDKARQCKKTIRKSNTIKNFGLKTIISFKLTDDEEEAARYVANIYDRLGFILKHDEELQTEILDLHGDVIAEMWLTLQPLIKEWRKHSRLHSTQFQRLGEIAVEIEKRAKQ